MNISFVNKVLEVLRDFFLPSTVLSILAQRNTSGKHLYQFIIVIVICNLAQHGLGSPGGGRVSFQTFSFIFTLLNH